MCSCQRIPTLQILVRLLSSACSVRSSANGGCMFSHKTPIGGTKHLGFISKASHTQDNQYQGKVLPSYQLSPAHPPPTWTETHTEEEVREETETKTPWEPSCQDLWKAPHQQVRRNQNFIKHKLSRGSLPEGSEGRSLSEVSTRSVSKVTGFWKVRVG